MNTPQGQVPEALRLADWLQSRAESIEQINAADELRRLHAQVAALTQPAQVSAVESNTAGAALPDFDELDDELIDLACSTGALYRVDFKRAWEVIRARLRASHGQAPAGAAELLDIAKRLAVATDEGDDQAQGTHYVDKQGVIRCKGSFLALIEDARAALRSAVTAQAAPAADRTVSHKAQAIPGVQVMNMAFGGCPECGSRSCVARACTRAAPAAGAVAGPVEADTVDLVGVRDNGEHVNLGKIAMPPRMKAREIAASQFGGFQDDDGSDAEMCFGAMEELLAWMTKQGWAAIPAVIPAAAPTPAAQADSGVQEDAARYQMVRRGQHWSVVDGIGNDLRAEALDAAVDAVRAQQKEGL